MNKSIENETFWHISCYLLSISQYCIVPYTGVWNNVPFVYKIPFMCLRHCFVCSFDFVGWLELIQIVSWYMLLTIHYTLITVWPLINSTMHGLTLDFLLLSLYTDLLLDSLIYYELCHRISCNQLHFLTVCLLRMVLHDYIRYNIST